MNLKRFMHKLLVQPSEKLLVQLFRYFIVSGLSLVVDFAVLYFLTDIIGLHYLISAALSYMVGLIVNYALSVWWVFYARKLDSKTLEFTVFAIIGLIGLGINELLMWSLVDLLGLYYMLARIISAGIGYSWKYVARKVTLFR